MIESRRALFLLAWRIQELVIMCLVLVSSTDGNGQGKVAETFYMFLLTLKKILERKVKWRFFKSHSGAKRFLFIIFFFKVSGEE